MKRIVGIAIAVFYGLLSGLAFTTASGNWFQGNADLGLWWSVIAALLGIAGLGAFFGTLAHTRVAED